MFVGYRTNDRKDKVLVSTVWVERGRKEEVDRKREYKERNIYIYSYIERYGKI